MPSTATSTGRGRSTPRRWRTPSRRTRSCMSTSTRRSSGSEGTWFRSAGRRSRPDTVMRSFQVIGTDQYYRCNDALYAPADAFASFFAWTAKYAPTKPVLVGEIGALSTCPVRSLRWLGNAKTRLLAHNVLAINWNLRTDP